MSDDLLTEQSHPDSQHLDSLSTPELLAVINAADAQVAAAVAAEIPRIARAVDAIAVAIGSGGHLVYKPHRK